MTPQEFFDEFGTLAESAEGVPKLRELILELAVRGKLVEQEPEDDLRQTIIQPAANPPARNSSPPPSTRYWRANVSLTKRISKG